MNSKYRFFSEQTLIKQSVGRWLLQDLQPSFAEVEVDGLFPITDGVIDELRQQLCSADNPRQQRQAALQLAAIGTDSVNALVYAFHEPCETCQVLAAYALRKIGAVAVKPLLESLDTCPLPVRQKLMWVLYSNGDKQVIDTLINCVSDPDRKVRRYAVWGLGHLKNTQAIPALVAALNDPYEKVRFDAGMALVKIGGEAVEALLGALYSGNARTRSQVAAILAWLQNDRALDALTDALRDMNPHVRAQAALALGWIGQAQSVDALMDALYDGDAEVRMQAASALGWIGDARAIDGLIGLIYDEDDWVPFSAADALVHLGDIRAIAPLMLASRGRNPRVREAAQDALCQLGYLLN